MEDDKNNPKYAKLLAEYSKVSSLFLCFDFLSSFVLITIFWLLYSSTHKMMHFDSFELKLRFWKMQLSRREIRCLSCKNHCGLRNRAYEDLNRKLIRWIFETSSLNIEFHRCRMTYKLSKSQKVERINPQRTIKAPETAKLIQ